MSTKKMAKAATATVTAATIRANRSNNNEAPAAKEGAAIEQQLILSAPYHLDAKSALFRQKYQDSIGYTVQAARLDSVHLRMSAVPISKTLECLGFTKVNEEAMMDDCILPDESRLNWTILASKGNNSLKGPSYMEMKPFVGRMYLMCNKWFLVQSLRQAEIRMRSRSQGFLTGSGEPFGYREFIPATLSMNAKNLEESLAEQPGIYLAKPARGSMGELMQLVRIRGDHVQEDLLSFLLASEFTSMRTSQVILQRYIERPLLIDKRKFDMRVYMLVVNPKRGDGSRERPRQSGYFAFHHPGFVRLCSAPYDVNHADIAVHLTNQSVQAKQTDTFRRLKEVTTWYPDELNHYLNKRRRVHPKDWAKDVLYPKVGAVLGYIATVFRYHLDDRDCPTSTFRVLGVDMLVDEQLRVYLLEFNELPAWGRQTSVLESIKPNLWREAICLISEVAVRYKTYLPIVDDQLATRQNFCLIYSSTDPGLARRNIAQLY